MNVVIIFENGRLKILTDTPDIDVTLIDRDVEGACEDRLELDADGRKAVFNEGVQRYEPSNVARYLFRTDCTEPRCPKCGCTRFAAHQVTNSEIVVNGHNDFLDMNGDDFVYDAGTPFGPYQCKRCGAEFNELNELLQPEEQKTP